MRCVVFGLIFVYLLSLSIMMTSMDHNEYFWRMSTNGKKTTGTTTTTTTKERQYLRFPPSPQPLEVPQRQKEHQQHHSSSNNSDFTTDDNNNNNPPKEDQTSTRTPPSVLSPNDYMGVCLLLKDDNHWLIEWLAYHYHVMPLRLLVVVVDKDSKTLPDTILHRWMSRKDNNKNTATINITVWHEDDFVPAKHRDPQFLVQAAKGLGNNTALMYHRIRQQFFYKKCMKELRESYGLEWLMFIDTDEFVVPSYSSPYLGAEIARRFPLERPGSVLKSIKYQQRQQLAAASAAPSSSSSMNPTDQSCVAVPRYVFGGQSNNPAENDIFMPLNLLDGTHNISSSVMLSQSFVYRQKQHHRMGKNILNLKRHPKEISLREMTPHRVSLSCPSEVTAFRMDHENVSYVRLHHYLGTKEQYLFRSDPRDHKRGVTSQTLTPAKPRGYQTRDVEQYDLIARQATFFDPSARDWVRGFVHDVGLDNVERLLEGVGIP